MGHGWDTGGKGVGGGAGGTDKTPAEEDEVSLPCTRHTFIHGHTDFAAHEHLHCTTHP